MSVTRSLFTAFLMVAYLHGSSQQVTDSVSSLQAGGTVDTFKTYKLTPFGFITHIPSDLWEMTKSPFQKKNLRYTAITVGSSVLLIALDQQVADETKKFAHTIHLNPETEYKTLITINNGKGGIKILKIPQNLNSAFYTLGEGWIGVAIGAGFLAEGIIGKNKRSVQTASDLMEGFIGTGITTQLLKRISGRQSPFMATAPGGRWHPFPSFSDFQNNTSNFDAFPSGHLTTMMMTITILAENYPERKWIRPLGYTLAGLTSFAMVNTDVHWAGDYPLALALGYLNGRIISARHKKPKQLLPLP